MTQQNAIRLLACPVITLTLLLALTPFPALAQDGAGQSEEVLIDEAYITSVIVNRHKAGAIRRLNNFDDN